MLVTTIQHVTLGARSADSDIKALFYKAAKEKKKTRGRERKSVRARRHSFCHVSRSLPPSLFCVFCCIADVVKGLHLKVTHIHSNQAHKKGKVLEK